MSEKKACQTHDIRMDTHGVCSDLISREAVLNLFPNGFYSGLAIQIKSLPSAEPKTGEWVDWLGKGTEWECSVCKCSIESHGSIAYKYCPMCGADMRGE